MELLTVPACPNLVRRCMTHRHILSMQMQVLVRYIDEVQACVLDARSAAAALCKPVPRAEKVGRSRSRRSPVLSPCKRA